MAEKEVLGAELAELYTGGLTLEETARQAGLRTRFAVAYRLRKVGVERRNRGSPVKTEEQKGAFARQQLERTFGESLSEVTRDLQAGVVTAKELAEQNNVKPSTLLTQFRRAGIEVPHKGGKYKKRKEQPLAEKPTPAISIFDLVDVDDSSKIINPILEKFSELGLSAPKVAAGKDEDLKILGFTPKEILYMRKQLERNRTAP